MASYEGHKVSPRAIGAYGNDQLVAAAISQGSPALGESPLTPLGLVGRNGRLLHPERSAFGVQASGREHHHYEQTLPIVVDNIVYNHRRRNSNSSPTQQPEQQFRPRTSRLPPVIIQENPPAPRNPRPDTFNTDTMCTTNIYTYLHPDGRREQYQQPTFCTASRHGQVCANNVVFQHPSELVTYDNTPYSYTSQLPPTPQYSPVPSSYRSGDESDRSYGSSSSKNKRASGLYINGQKVLDLNRRERRPSSRHERIVLVDSPPTPRTPPQTWTAPHTAPASPNSNTYIVDASRDPTRRRPVIVDERTHSNRHVEIEVVDSKRSKHSRHASNSSRESRHSDEEEQRRRRRREEKRHEEQDQRLRARILEANAEIAGRPVVPAAPQLLRRSSTYKRPSVEVPDREAELIEAVRRLDFEEERRNEKARRLAKKEEKKEEEAQRQRLMERMQPKRRATVGPGSRRQRVLYDDGVYRWE
ncbi:hypothetical protein FZEAL_1030 [Fusarium zealandicum]|uniref:Uncharacterized protein n=1 Tax=Fusarium zealandicum TaxID=1053134 RepID=A0A8H4UU88_9HYPO|nr:hypothetical protein FZEAL_1030 [Fusarium zealandicum]